MRRFVACLGILICGGLLLATGITTDRLAEGPAGPKVAEDQVVAYAEQLLQNAHEIRWRYERPVPMVELLYAALSGLYETARIPVPDGLRSELEHAAERASTNPSVVPADTVGAEKLNEWSRMHGPFSEVVARARRGVGDVEPLRGNAALLVSLRALTKCLDPHSKLIGGAELLRGTGREMNTGVGLELQENGGGPLLLKTVVPGSPAQRAGLRPGDVLTHINGRPTGPMVADQTQVTLNRRFDAAIQQVSAPPLPAPRPTDAGSGSADNHVELALEREAAGRKRSWKVVLEKVDYHAETVLGIRRRDDNSWDYLLDRDQKIAQLRLGEIGPSTADDLRSALNHLRQEGVRGLVLDLRWCPGGILKGAVDVAGLFIKEGTVSTVRMRTQGETTYRSEEGLKVLDLPLVVLVNAETSGGAELVAAALQDHGRGHVVGQRTVGKGSVQTMIYLPIPDTGLKVTSGMFIRPNGKGLHRFPESKSTDDWGVRPDAGLDVRISPELDRRLREAWLLQTLRPGGATTTLPLDDPEFDPQLQEALRALAESKK